MAIVNIRGTNGSGKSSIIHKLLGANHANVRREVALASYETPKGKPRDVVGYELMTGTIVVGPYRTQCGGCDAIPTQDLVCDAVRAAAELSRRVVFEGVLVSGLFSRYSALATELERSKPRRRVVFAFMGTPYETCLERIYARNGGKKIKEENVLNKWRSIESAKAKLIAEGRTVVDLPWRRIPVAKVRDLLEK